jgi:hypothetical protein
MSSMLLELSALENNLKIAVDKLKKLSVDFNAFKCDLKHTLTQHLHPQQFGG